VRPLREGSWPYYLAYSLAESWQKKAATETPGQ